MKPTDQPQHDRTLFHQLRWFIGLRWLAGAAVLLISIIDALWLNWHERATAMIGVGAGILAYNLVLWTVMRPRRARSLPLLVMAWVQITLDLACLTALAVWTGGSTSPLLGFFVFHMVFASLLLSRVMAYAAALEAIVLLCLALAITNRWPATLESRIALSGWGLVLILTVYLTNHITRSLHSHHQRLVRQNRRIRSMSRQLQRQQKAMIQHEKMAAMGQMAAGVAHEIANPLANLDSILQLMQRNPQRLNESNFTRLREQVERIRTTIRHMTDFAHPTQMDWQLTPVNRLVEQAMQMMRFDHRQRKVDFRIEPTPGSCAVRIQPHAMQQVLVNVLMNALDAVADVAKPQISIRCGCTADACRIEIADNGSGIAPEHLDHLFEPFFTTKPVGSGTGLGLAISYRLVENQGGRIEVDSTPGRGTTVRILIQRADSPPCDSSCSPSNQSSVTSSPTTPGNTLSGPSGG